jgi:hypothetical protein
MEQHLSTSDNTKCPNISQFIIDLHKKKKTWPLILSDMWGSLRFKEKDGQKCPTKIRQLHIREKKFFGEMLVSGYAELQTHL